MLRILIGRLLVPLLRAIYRPHVSGREHIPSEGPVILAGNHLAFSDSPFIALVAPRKVFFLGKNEYLTGHGIRGRFKAAFFKSSGMIPVDRDGARGAAAALSVSRSVLDSGHVLGIHPEGTRSPDGRLYKGRTGIARLALMTGATVVPCALIGTDRIQPNGKRIPRIRRITIRFGKPMTFSRYAGRDKDRVILRAITDEIMREIMELSGQEYVDVYATKIKAA